MEILCGIPGTQESFIQKAEDLDCNLLISANAFWNNKTKKFQGWGRITERSVNFALDCGGFVAMAKYGGYRWTIWDYIEFAMEARPMWWSAMDFCCEPEIATNQNTVTKRVRDTVQSLAQTLANLIALEREIPNYVTSPIPVLQGWKPQDYVDCIHLTEDSVWSSPEALKEIGVDGWPDLVGLGSVCRRDLHGEDGIIAILNKVDQNLPPNVKLHLFGVKSQAAQALKDHPRIQSVDSMAWNMAARWEAFKAKKPKTKELLTNHMENWVRRQREKTRPSLQLQLV